MNDEAAFRGMEWAREFNGALTICDREGIILYMNEKSGKTFEKWGGTALVGKSLMDCHNPHSQQMIRTLLDSGGTNVYTIEKNGVKKLVYQGPWLKDGAVAGLVELSLEIPFEMPHFIRK